MKEFKEYYSEALVIKETGEKVGKTCPLCKKGRVIIPAKKDASMKNKKCTNVKCASNPRD